MNQSIPAQMKEKIFNSANELYEQLGKEKFPTVDQVRRHAQVDMNAASSVMRDWRRSQTAQAAPVAVLVPDAVVQANQQVITALWSQAQELANESLRAAQSAWDVERNELDEMRQELAQAYESQAVELDQLKSQYAASELANQEAAKLAAMELSGVKADLAQALTKAERAEAQAGEIERRATDLRSELDKAHEEMEQLRGDLALALARAERAEAQAGEIEHRANDLKGELDRSHADLDKLRSELADHQRGLNVALSERDETKTSLTKAVATAEAQAEAHNNQRNASAKELLKQTEQKEAALKEAATAREHAAELSGKLAAVQEQNAAILSRLVPATKPA